MNDTHGMLNKKWKICPPHDYGDSLQWKYVAGGATPKCLDCGKRLRR